MVGRAFDPGYSEPPFRELVADAPGKTVYPPKEFRLEWGPVFHRGRLDGSACVLIVGQDPAQHETILRRILVGEASHRIQGFLWKLGLRRSYVMVNTFLYSVYGQRGLKALLLRPSLDREAQTPIAKPCLEIGVQESPQATYLDREDIDKNSRLDGPPVNRPRRQEIMHTLNQSDR